MALSFSVIRIIHLTMKLICIFLPGAVVQRVHVNDFVLGSAQSNLYNEAVDNAEKIWCPRSECFKFIQVCEACKGRLKCDSYKNYIEPMLFSNG